MTLVDSGDDLAERLGAFWRDHYDGGTEGRHPRRRKVQAAALALVIALLSWIAFSYPSEPEYRSYDVPVVMQGVPDDWTVSDPEPLNVAVRLEGPRAAFRALESEALALTFDMAEVQEGTNEFAVTEHVLDLPPQLELDEARPRVVTVEAQSMQRTRARVVVRSQGPLADSLELFRLSVEPDSVTVLFPRGAEPLHEVRTEIVELGQVRGDTTMSRTVVVRDDARLAEQSEAEVEVRVDVRARQ